MTDWLIGTAWAAEAPVGQPAPELLSPQNILLFAVLFGIWYVMLIRPHRKRQQQQQEMVKQLKKGDTVVTIGGIHGTVHAVKEETIFVRVDDKCTIEFSRSAVAQVVNNTDAPADKDSGK